MTNRADVGDSGGLLAHLRTRLKNDKWMFVPKAGMYGVLYVRRFLGRTRRRAVDRVAFAPQVPHRAYMQWKVLAYLGLRPEPASDEPDEREIRFFFNDATAAASPNVDPSGWLNAGGVDISKSRVAEVFEAVFGYGLRVDPRTYTGPMVAKGETNATHDGRIVEGPITDPPPNTSFQVVVDNTTDDGCVEDLRTAVVGRSLAVVFAKRRPIDTRFSNDNTAVRILPPERVYSDDERRKILAFSEAFKLDMGEIDVLRDKSSGRLYIVDVATTPHSPPDRTIGRGSLRAVRAIARAFDREFLQTPRSDQPAGRRSTRTS
jgi:hypothetical protein